LLVQLDNLALSYYNEALPLAKTPATISEAMEKLHVALAVDPKHVDTYIVLGKFHAQRGEYEEAIGFWRRALEFAPDGAAAREKIEKAIQKAEQLLQHQREEQAVAQQQKEEAKRAAQRRQQVITTAIAVSTLVLGIFVTSLTVFLRSRVSPEEAAPLVQQALQQHPALQEAQLRVSGRNHQIVIEGEVPSPLHKDLVMAVAQHSAARQSLDTSRLQVRPTHLAAKLQQALWALFTTLSSNLRDSLRRDLVDALATVQITVTPAGDNRLRLTGTVVKPEIKEIIEQVVVSLVDRDQADMSGIRVLEDHIVYVIQPGDHPEAIARRLCGSRQRLEAIRNFTKENAEVLKDPHHLRVGAVLRIPKRLLMTASRG
jgi:nucleoid-associated protein YgaU